MANRIEGTTLFTDPVTFGDGVTGIGRDNLDQDDLQPYAIPATAWRIWDAVATFLAATGANDDLGLTTGTAGTDVPTLITRDMKAIGAVTNAKAAIVFPLPPEYVTAETVRLRITAGMLTTVADFSATIDCSVYRADGEGASGSDLVQTAAQNCNSLTKDEFDFECDASSLSPGDELLVIVNLAVRDNATGTVVQGEISRVAMLLDIQG